MNAPRLFAYITAAFVTGAISHTLLGMFVSFTLLPGWPSWVALALYGGAYAYLSFRLSRRYLLKEPAQTRIAYLLSVLMAVGPILMSHIKEDFPDPAGWIRFGVVLLAGTLAGARASVRNTIQMPPIMRRSIPVFLLALGVTVGACAQPKAEGPSLDEKIGQMLMVGFRGTVATSDSTIARYIRDYHLGSVIFFDIDVERMVPDRNIASPAQVRALVDSLQSFAKVPLFIAIDQEGGRVNRLKVAYGFPGSVSAQYLGGLDNLDSTRHYADITARTLKELGINVNFAPVVDLNTNPDNPVIGRIQRSYGADPALVARHAMAVVEAHKAHGIVTTFKHFPGHGSAWNDSHLGMADVTETWRDIELAPYRTAIEAGVLDAIMTAHIFHAKLDADHPGTLSRHVIGKILRKDLGFGGLVYSDDMQMKAVADFYGLEQAIELAVNAGVDILTFGNNTHSYEPDIAERAFRTLKSLVEQGRIPMSRIDEANARILDVKTRYGVIDGTR